MRMPCCVSSGWKLLNRRVRGQLGCFVWVKQKKLCQQLRLVFNVRRVFGNAFHRANNHTLGFVEVPYAFSALVGVNFINFFTHVNCAVRTLWLANVTIDAFIGDDQCHGDSTVVGLSNGFHLGTQSGLIRHFFF